MTPMVTCIQPLCLAIAILCLSNVQCFLTPEHLTEGSYHTDMKASEIEGTLYDHNSSFTRRFYTNSDDNSLAKWPNGQVEWCLLKEWPADVPHFHLFLVNGQLNWEMVGKYAHHFIEDAMSIWNPDKSAAIWHKPTGFCPENEGAVLRVKVGMYFKAQWGNRKTANSEGFYFAPLEVNDPKALQQWRHEWGHVLGFFHEHQRPDLWREGHEAFHLLLENFQDYNKYFDCDNGMVRGHTIPEDIREKLNKEAVAGGYHQIPEGGTFDFDLMGRNIDYAHAVGASWQQFLPFVLGRDIEKVVMGSQQIGDGLPDLDAIMLYGTAMTVWKDPNLPQSVNGGWRIPWALTQPRMNHATGKMNVIIPTNMKPSEGEKARLKAMYPKD